MPSAAGGEESTLTPQAASQRAVAPVGNIQRGALDLSTPLATNGHDVADELTVCDAILLL